MSSRYEPESVSRAELDQRAGACVVQFGTNWCGWCRAAEPHIEAAFAAHADLTRLKIEDGSGRPLGRSFKVKLWPTLVFLKDGIEVARVTRPDSTAPISAALLQL